jgi:two-component system, NarL family, nitrate/nitrite response regulator NarL
VNADKLTVALLDDHTVVRESLADYLTHSGVTVLGQFGAADAFVESVLMQPPAVAIVDVMLEQADGRVSADGVQVIEVLRQKCGTTAPMVLSARRDDATVERCYAAGAAAYLYKLTATCELVLQTVHAVARGERFLPVRSFDGVLAGPLSGARPAGVLSRVTPREREVLAHLAQGHDNLKIAAELGITERTAKAHVASLYKKLGVENRPQLALLARDLLTIERFDLAPPA